MTGLMQQKFTNIYPKFILVFFLVLFASVAKSAAPVSSVIEGKYRDVKNNVIDAIRSKGINIANRLHASDMLNRTREDFGAKKDIFANAEIIEFCSAKISHALSQASHQNILLCPFKIAVYNLEADQEKVHIVYKIPEAMDEESAPAIAMIDELIKSIVEEASW